MARRRRDKSGARGARTTPCRPDARSCASAEPHALPAATAAFRSVVSVCPVRTAAGEPACHILTAFVTRRWFGSPSGVATPSFSTRPFRSTPACRCLSGGRGKASLRPATHAGLGPAGTTISSCGRLLTGSAPSAVTTTMSSMRAPHWPGSRCRARRRTPCPRPAAVVARHDVGLLVHRQPDAVAGAVHEASARPASASTSRATASTCSAVTPGRTARRPPAGRAAAPNISAPLRVGLADAVGAGRVGVVAGFVRAADVDDDDVAGPHLAVRALVVRVGAVRPGARR